MALLQLALVLAAASEAAAFATPTHLQTSPHRRAVTTRQPQMVFGMCADRTRQNNLLPRQSPMLTVPILSPRSAQLGACAAVITPLAVSARIIQSPLTRNIPEP